MRRGGSFISVLIALIVIAGIILFAIPYLKVNSDKSKIKKALYQTQRHMVTNNVKEPAGIRRFFFRRIGVGPKAEEEDKLSVEVLDEDFIINDLGNNVYKLQCRYVNEHVIVPVLKIKMGVIDKYLETEEFDLY